MAAVAQDGLALQFAAETLQADKEQGDCLDGCDTQ